VGRVLRKLDEPYLDPLGRFLTETYGAPRSFYPELADLMIWAKEKLRDRVAHGFVDVGDGDLKVFREQLLFGFKKYKRGALAVLLQAPK
jgi:hypothetical protein